MIVVARRGLTAPELSDRVPFFVRPPAGATADVLFLVPTFTYLAYGNERMATDEEAVPGIV